MKKYFTTVLAFILFVQVNLFAQPPAGEAKPGDYYGEKVKSKGAITLTDAVNKLELGMQLSDVKIKAKITEVCPNKGCWLKLELPEGNQAMVTMKDYGFFVPLTAKGKTIIIEGQAEIKTVSVKELKHYAEDAKKSQAEIDAITQPKKEVNIMAKGIVVLK